MKLEEARNVTVSHRPFHRSRTANKLHVLHSNTRSVRADIGTSSGQSAGGYIKPEEKSRAATSPSPNPNRRDGETDCLAAGHGLSSGEFLNMSKESATNSRCS